MKGFDLAGPFRNFGDLLRIDPLLAAGQGAMLGGLGLCLAIVLLCVTGIALRDRRFVRAARRGMYGMPVLLFVASAGLVHGFVAGVYDLKYIFEYSERAQTLPFKIAGLWAGLDGSLLFWALLVSIYAGLAARTGRRETPPARVRMEPYLYPVLAIVLGFFLVVTNFLANPFQVLGRAEIEGLVSQGRATLAASGAIADGSGLNPLLNNYWMLIHPPSLYVGFTGFTIPFAFAAAALLSGELGLYWIRATRAWTMIAWLFLTNGIILGGLWAYEVLGWGGYWAWDPVENASFLPWLTATAFLHTVMVVERRNMLKRWNMFLVLLTFFLTLFGTYLTRSGVVASVHSFSARTLGDCFFGFLAFIFAGGGALIALRSRELSSQYRIRSLVSREAAFLFNNLVLVAIAAAILLLTVWPTISANLLGRELSIGPPTYALVTTPLFAILVLLTAIGPGVGWVRSTPRLLKRNLLVPLFVAVGVVTLALLFWLVRKEPVSLYPPLLVGFATFAFGSAVSDFVRGVRARRATRPESRVRALGRLAVANNRRYGGYVSHIGFCLVVLGIVGSAFFREKQDVRLAIGETLPVAGGRYDLHYVGEFQGDTGVFTRDVQHFTVHRGERLVTELYPERRFYKKKDQWTTEVAIFRNRTSPLFDDLYVFFAGRDPSGGRNIFTIFHNPLINWIWVGWIVILAGGVFAALPMRRQRRVGLAE